jgi:hypothetical protein
LVLEREPGLVPAEVLLQELGLVLAQVREQELGLVLVLCRLRPEEYQRLAQALEPV